MSRFVSQTMLVARREAGALLSMPLWYVLAGVFFLLESLFYVLSLVEFARGGEGMSVNVTDSVVRPIFHTVHFFLLVQVPLLTMRVFAEDRASGMLDLLQTTPVQEWPLLAGKWLATWFALSLYAALTLVFPLTTAALGDVEWPVVIGSFAALLFSAAAYGAIGLFFSSITESQVVAAVLSYVTLFVFVFAGAFADAARSPALSEAVRHFSVNEHAANLLSGNLTPMDFAYYACLAAMFLFFTARILELRRRRA